VDSGELADGVAQYRLYEVDGVTTVVAINLLAALTMTGPYDAVVDVFEDFPL